MARNSIVAGPLVRANRRPCSRHKGYDDIFLSREGAKRNRLTGKGRQSEIRRLVPFFQGAQAVNRLEPAGVIDHSLVLLGQGKSRSAHNEGNEKS